MQHTEQQDTPILDLNPRPSIWLCSELTVQDIRTAIKNSGGVKGSLLIPEAPFELLVRRAIQRLLPPALQCKEVTTTKPLDSRGHFQNRTMLTISASPHLNWKVLCLKVLRKRDQMMYSSGIWGKAASGRVQNFTII